MVIADNWTLERMVEELQDIDDVDTDNLNRWNKDRAEKLCKKCNFGDQPLLSF